MALAKLALRLDGRFLLAAFGLASAMLVPLAGVLATAGLQPQVDAKGGTVLFADDEDGLSERSVESATWVLAGRDDPASGRHIVAYVKGAAQLAPGQAFDGGTAGRTLEVGGHRLSTIALPRSAIGPGLVLVHPSILGPAPLEAAGFTGQGPGAAVPARGGDAFEIAGIRELKDHTTALTLVSLPLVVLVASAFARLEARSLTTAVAVVTALGRPERAGQILTARALLLAACGALFAVAAIVAAIWLGFLPVDLKSLAGRSIAFSVAVPAFAAAVAGSAIAWTTVWKARALLRERPALGGEPRLAWLPIETRPMVTGWRIVGVLVLVGAVVALDVGLPLSAAGVPAALAGGDGELVVGADSASITAGRTSEAPAHVMEADPAVDAIVAEVFVPTVMQGKPFVLRGGAWRDLADYHGLQLLEGDPPGAAEVALGQRGAGQLGLEVGGSAWVVGEGGRLARLTVSGIYDADGLLTDEGVIGLANARRLANLPEGVVHAVRLRPETPEARAAMNRDAPEVQVLQVSVLPRDAPAGSLATAVASVVNLSGVPGTRVLNLRIGGAAVTTASVSLPGYGEREVGLPFLVPAGSYAVAVNPETAGFGESNARSLTAPTGAVVGRGFVVELRDEGNAMQGETLALFANGTAALDSAPLATATTDEAGRATFTLSRTGLQVVATRDEDPAAVQVYGIATADADRARFVVETAYTTPATPAPGQAATVAARVRNVGGVEGTQRVPFTIDGQDRGYKDVDLGPGEAATVELAYAPRRSGESVTVLGVAVTSPRASVADGPTVSLGPTAAGGSLQSQVADRLLGNARGVLGGLALTAAVSAIAVLVLSARRTLASRSGIVAVLATVWQPAEIRRRAAVEGAILGAIGGIGGVLVAKAFIVLVASMTTVRAFGHALGDPYSLVFMVQVAGTTAFLTSLTLHNAVAKRLSAGVGRTLRSGEAA